MKNLVLFVSLLLVIKVNSQNVNVSELELSFLGDSYPQRFAKGITKLYFAANDDIHDEELWVYDQITDSTYMVKDISSGSGGLDNSILMTVGDILYFTDDSDTQLWRSDGTESGTYLVKQINTNFSSYSTINKLFNYNGNLVFGANDDITGQELWISDGTTSGTVLLKDIRLGANGSNPSNFFEFNGLLYFTASDGINGREIWKTDGTTIGTELLKNIDGTNFDSLFSGKFIELNDSFYFYAATNDNGFELWKSDGTAAGTELFLDILPGNLSSNSSIVGAGTSNYFIFEVNTFAEGTELWKCDGTIAGTTLLKDINIGSSSSVNQETQFVVFNDKIYFNPFSTENGNELWVTDGTNVGTQLVKDIRTGTQNSNITELTATSSYLVFSAQGDEHNYYTLWKSDGTTSGTFELKDTNMGQTTAGMLSFEEFNNEVYFPSGYNSLNGVELWKTDGTSGNTILYKDIAHRYSGVNTFYDVAEINSKIIYTGMTGEFPAVSDGTINGTMKLSNANAGSSVTPDRDLSAFYSKAGNYVFFKASANPLGYELWKTDGTEANTSMVKDIRPGNSSSLTDDLLFMVYNNIFYFKANDGIHGEELWRSDGSETGTYLVKDINVGSVSSLGNQTNIYYNSPPPRRNDISYAVLDGYLYFTANDGTDNSIWKTDGTESGTSKVITMPQEGSSASFPHILGSVNNKIFFYSYTTLYSTDGTQAGTTNLITFTSPSYLFGKTQVLNNEFYFVGRGDFSYELWKTDGSPTGTTLVKDGFIFGGFASLKTCGNHIYFTIGSSGNLPRQLWRTDGTTAGTILLEEIPTTTFDYFRECETCYQDSLLFLRAANDNKIWYVNSTSTNSDTYLTTSINNAAPFAVQSPYTIQKLYKSSFGLFFTANSERGGTELYSTAFDITLDIPDFSNNQDVKSNIIIYPNPTKNIINIKTRNGELISKVKVYDLLGKELYAANAIVEYDLSYLNNGIYIVKVFTDKSTYSSKLVIKK